MKFNKLIAKGLTLGFLLNSTSILSYANTEIPNRYQTLEGEYITIDDSIEGNLEEIEIFGNTVQDENNLEDIQSVGDLYVDENGNPILDSQGREQYKIVIYSESSNLINPNRFEFGCTNYHTGENQDHLNTKHLRYKDFIRVKPSSRYYGYDDLRVVTFFDKDKKPIGFKTHENYFDTPSNCKYIKIRTFNEHEDIELFKEKVYLSNDGQYRPYKSNFITILLPAQLQKVGDIADRLYWDNNKGRYIIEKKIGSFIIDGTEPVRDIETTNDIYIVAQFTKDLSNFITGNNLDSINNMGIKNTSGDNIYTGIYDGAIEAFLIENSFVRIKILKSRLTEEGFVEDLKGVAKYFNKYNFVSHMIINPKLIETNMTSKIKLPIYDEKTHIYVNSENGINPTLKVTVDRLPQIAKEAVIQAERDNTTHNIALARRYINMLPESSYKDQLQEQLSEIFSSDMVLDRKTVTSNLDLYIKCENILQMSLSTNSITFEDFSGIEDMVEENAVQISINSSLPYSLNAYLPTEIQNADKSNTMDKDILNIKENSESVYQTFANTTDKIILKDNNQAGNDLIHNIDVKLKGGIAHEKDVYKTTIKFEAEQK